MEYICYNNPMEQETPRKSCSVPVPNNQMELTISRYLAQ
jgi:hypothetical protein